MQSASAPKLYFVSDGPAHKILYALAKLHLLKQACTQMREYIRSFIKQVSMLPKDELLGLPIQARHFTITAPGLTESLQIDYCGPFPADEEGNTHVLTVIDTFTKAVGLYAVKDLEAKHTARCLIRQIGIFGCPSQIVRDRQWSPIH